MDNLPFVGFTNNSPTDSYDGVLGRSTDILTKSGIFYSQNAFKYSLLLLGSILRNKNNEWM